MNWQDFQDAIVAWIENSLGIKAIWMNQARQNIPKPFVTLQIISMRSIGEDEVRYETELLNDPGHEEVPTVAGLRQITIRVIAYSRDQRAGLDGVFFIEKARSSLWRPTIKTALQTAGIGYVSDQPLISQDASFDQRYESICAMDVTFNVAYNLTNAEDETGYIDKAEMTSDITGLASELQIDHEIFGNI